MQIYLAIATSALIGGASGLSLPITEDRQAAACSRSKFLSTVLLGGSVAACGIPSLASAAEEAIAPCPKTQGPKNCVSTASVRDLSQFMSPWTYPSDMSKEEALARIKGACSTNVKLEVVAQTENTLKVKAVRNFSTDEIKFLVNPDDRVIFFASRQVDGPDAPDFGENRKRLEDIRRRVGVFGVMGEGMAYTEDPREGAFGQLKAFYGIQSGKGFESVILDEED